jgi:beta-N-acetylhexosaminidase
MININEVSLRDRIGQMLLIGFNGSQISEHSSIVSQMEQCNIGGVILFDYDFKSKAYDKNIKTVAQVSKLTSDLRKFNKISNEKNNRPDTSLIISVDYEGGQVNRLKEQYGFPQTLTAKEVGNMSDMDIYDVAMNMSRTLLDSGFNLNFAPVIDVDVNCSNPILGMLDRCFAADATRVAHVAKIFMQVFLKNNIIPVLKHFPGHGSSKDDSHLGFVDVTDTWQELELEPYKILLKEQTDNIMIMTAHIINRNLDDKGLPATLSYDILTKILRNKLGFTGLIISDDMQMKAISDEFSLEESLLLAVNAGNDMMIFGNQLSEDPQDCKEVIDIIERNVVAGLISEHRVNDAYKRILNIKQGLL